MHGRIIKYKAKGKVTKRAKWRYTGTAWDIESGISEKSKDHASTQGAIEHSTLKLLERLKREGLWKEPKNRNEL